MTDKKLLKPQNNKLQISNKRDSKHFIFLSKIFLDTFETIELHALSDAITVAT